MNLGLSLGENHQGRGMPRRVGKLRSGYFTPTSSTSNTSVALGGIGPPGVPRAP